MQGILLQIGYFERGLSKRFKKVNFIFLSNRMLSVCHLHVLVSYVYVTGMFLVCTRMSFVCHSYVLVCHPYVTRMYSYVIRMSRLCTRMSSVCHSYVLVCHPYVACTYSYIIRRHSYVVLPWTADNWSIDNDSCKLFTTCIHNLFTDHLHLQKK